MTAIHRRVRLKSFNGSIDTPEACNPGDNYWLLIGHTGAVIAQSHQKQRVLVKFDLPVSSFGLCCHNEAENSLFILEADLELLNESL